MPTEISGTTGVSQIQDGTVATADIADDAITNAKVDTIAATKLTGTIADARFPATLPAASGANLTALPAANLTGTVADARISALTSSKLTGALPAISAANLTSIPAANITGTLPAISATNLTSIPAANITGTLPAISGANLTGISDTNGLVLTGSSVENSPGGTTYSAITIDQCFNSTYQHYLIVASYAIDGSGQNVNFRYRTGSSGSETTYTAAKYKQCGMEIRMASGGSITYDYKNQDTGTSFEIAESATAHISNGNYFTMNVFNPQQANAWTTATYQGTNYTSGNALWHRPQSLTLVGSAAGRPTGFTIYAASGNLDEHGIRVYGYANS